MKIINVSQANETDEWLEARKGKITGSAGDGQLSSKLGVAFWNMLAERIAAPADSENAAERGHRLENINAQLTVEAHHLKNPVYDTKLWVREDYPDIAVSPDCHEDTGEPTWAVECKSLSSAKHLSIVVPIVLGETWEQVSGKKHDSVLDYLPAQYRFQALQYFVVDDSLQHLYFSFYDPRVMLEHYQRVDVDIKREAIQDEITERLEAEKKTLEVVGTIREAGGENEAGF
jgi:hypothetical protein